jgi:hypothetical protein
VDRTYTETVTAFAPLKCDDPHCETCRGYAEAFEELAALYESKDDTERADHWRAVAAEYRAGLKP